ncbi:MAG: succinyl-diaminopimelate desuccinylase [Acidimicrobiia bacterium]
MSNDVLGAVVDHEASDLVGLTEALVAVDSVSGNEAALCDAIQQRLALRAPHLVIDRVGNSLVARTMLARDRRIILGGHLDTVPANGNAIPRRDGDLLFGLGTADMKGSVAAMLALAEQCAAPAVDVTFLFYECEEVEEARNGLRSILAAQPELLNGDLAILAEPTDGWVEAGCQGTLHVRATYRGVRAHSARPWTGKNAIHAASAALARVVAAAEILAPRVIDGMEFTQALQVVRIDGGVANNVVPDEASITVNRRFAPDITCEQARAETNALFEDADVIEVLNESPGALPGLEHPLVAEFVDRAGGRVRSKLGWTDVARFTPLGIPALNFGAGDPLLAHTAEEHVSTASLKHTYDVLREVLA